ncbi:ras guanine nucleotide exchange factor domain-containing protein [Choanephora cucurbitarum]|nr:ras guanine nucleotide exchange factor domain-containing protein [Choanephora cucurbitarum]
MSILLNYTSAMQLLEQGDAKDAYTAFLSIIESSIQQLHAVKFVHQTIISKPLEYESYIALLRSSINQLEDIAIKRSPGATFTKINTETISTSPSLAGSKSSSPPLPPRPSFTHQKPFVPPKPSIIVPPPIPARKSLDATSKRSRGNSVSFAEDKKIQKMVPNENQASCIQKNATNLDEYEDDDDDDDEDEEIIEFPSPVHKKSMTSLSPDQLSPKTRPRSQSWVVPKDSLTHSEEIDVLSETVIDPRNLVPAQSNAGDSLSLPNTSQANGHIPNIPAPPLLSTHRRLQQRLKELEADLEVCSPQDVLLQAERQQRVLNVRQTLEKVRSLYMSAMTIPSILQFPPHLIAYQLTLIESSIFRGIPQEALLSHSARTPHKKVSASTDFFNFITRSIEHSILLPQEASDRAEVIRHWIKIAVKLLALNNYQTLKAIVSALGTPPIQRLRRTWECIPKKRMARLERINNLMSEADNYCRYREHVGLEKKQPWSKPVVPFLGVFIHDITYLSATSKGNSRAQDVSTLVQLFQRAPEYPQVPPASYLNVTSKRHLFRPMSDALHFGSSSKKTNNKSTTAILMGEDQREEIEIELEQQLIMQYILMRPWMGEKAIDALSNLREAPKPRSTSSSTAHLFNNDGRSVPLSSTVSLVSNQATLASNSLNVNQSELSPVSLTHRSIPQNDLDQIVYSPTVEETKRSIVGGFWPFRKSSETPRAPMMVDVESMAYVNQQWSEKDVDEKNSIVHLVDSVFTKPSRSGAADLSKKRGHNRSASLPSKSILVSNAAH